MQLCRWAQMASVRRHSRYVPIPSLASVERPRGPARVVGHSVRGVRMGWMSKCTVQVEVEAEKLDTAAGSGAVCRQAGRTAVVPEGDRA